MIPTSTLVVMIVVSLTIIMVAMFVWIRKDPYGGIAYVIVGLAIVFAAWFVYGLVWGVG